MISFFSFENLNNGYDDYLSAGIFACRDFFIKLSSMLNKVERDAILLMIK